MPAQPGVGRQTFLESDGKAVYLTLDRTIPAEVVIYKNGFLGITGSSGDSGGRVSLIIDRREYQFTVPATLTVNLGDTVYVDTAAMSGELIPPDAAYSTTAGAGKIALFKATMTKDSNNNVTGILLPSAM